MTNYKFDGKSYFYVLFETGNKGFILSEKNLDFTSFTKTEKEFFELAESISEETLLKEIGYVSSYEIKTHKAEIDTTNTIATSFDKQRRNTMYLIHTKEKVSDFSNYQRLHPSREQFFFSNPRIAELPKISEYYLN
ncbi:hypothetical protein [Epilithonimonas hominis]|uniref:hypothetical protein n=1 Tax=Epilithonimonas hominis TaxID=420404 RepID=UPI0028A22E2F|nr:hypothetical protein [Epilithonimonas hominis]